MKTELNDPTLLLNTTKCLMRNNQPEKLFPLTAFGQPGQYLAGACNGPKEPKSCSNNQEKPFLCTSRYLSVPQGCLPHKRKISRLRISMFEDFVPSSDYLTLCLVLIIRLRVASQKLHSSHSLVVRRTWICRAVPKSLLSKAWQS